MQSMELGMECLNREISGYQLLCETMAERNRAHDQIIRLRAILGSFKENLKSAIEITQRELESQCEFFSKGHGGRERCLQEQAKLEAYKHSLQRLEQIEMSTR